MDKKNHMELQEGMEKISLRLGALHNMIFTLHLGMQTENMDRQTLDCVESINFCVNDIKTLADECLLHISENHNNINENEMA